MRRFMLLLVLLSFQVIFFGRTCAAEQSLQVVADFEGASVKVTSVDQAARSISFAPGGDPARGWPCWWYFRVDHVIPGESLSLTLRGSKAKTPKGRVLSATWAMPQRAAYSYDGVNWLQTEAGKRQQDSIVYQLRPLKRSVYVAWGPPFTPNMSTKLVQRLSKASPAAHAVELCRSREDRPVPMLHIYEGERAHKQRFGVWVQARQHAWESGSSWVAQGFAEWIVSEEVGARWLRQHADIFIVPIMDIDNTATGNGGKNALPHDHNRDWSSQPHWNEIKAAQQRIHGLIDQGRMDVFLDLHNPAPGDPTFFYVLPRDLLKKPMLVQRDRFIELAYARISKVPPFMPMSNKPKVTGPNYHPLWRQISSNYVAMHGNSHTVSLCLETAWNSKHSNTQGYRAVGAGLAASVGEYLGERPLSLPGTLPENSERNGRARRPN